MYTMVEAVKATGKSKATLHRAIKTGKISATKNENGHNIIDPAELHRVFPAVSVGLSNERPMTRSERPSDSDELAVLKAENALLKEMAEDRKETIDDLRERLDTSEANLSKSQAQLTALITDDRPKELEKKHGFLARIIGRK